ncbi:hypothetical protein [Streptococcus macacae]|uniref:Uncharacterized protein n=1 Tax=Streptococcus macacae NCTC 11558 TaxID=764298 RepID=G5JU28_9STRE|nr:hypothetical protein [Streptococcus macacae]EHJ52895.1 hypothetical protein STRMA_0568 [Streptococcus macacae NCTC 11558]SUN78393.1 putative immunity protein [Streptococcus macacae NCTC 11558]
MIKKENQQFKLWRLFTAQLIALCLLIMVVTQAIFKSPLLVQIGFFIITLCTAGLNYYFVKELQKTASKENSVAVVTNQLVWAVIFLLLSLLSCYKVISVRELYSRIIFSAAAVICFLLFILLLWGVKYVKQAQTSLKETGD